MKKSMITIIVAILAIQARATDLKSQLPGYWVPDANKTLELATKEKRKVDLFLSELMPGMAFEFQPGKMTLHIRGNQVKNPPEYFTIKSVDEASNTLVLDFKKGKPQRKATINGDQLTLSWQEETMILTRISEETFVSRFTPPPPAVDDITEAEIPAGPAKGSVHGVDFSIEKAELNNGDVLLLRQGAGFFPDHAFQIFTFGGSAEKLAGRTILVKPNRKGNQMEPHIYLKYKVDGRDLPELETFTEGYSMKLEFGAASEGKIPGKIHLRLPDAAKSFVIGTFEVEVE